MNHTETSYDGVIDEDYNELTDEERLIYDREEHNHVYNRN